MMIPLKVCARRWVRAGVTGLLLTSPVLFAAAETATNQITDPYGAGAVSPADILENWTNFRGPGSNGHAAHANPPRDWNGAENRNILWKTAVPKHGMSSPVVWENRLFLTGADDSTRQVYCFDTDTGKLLWQHDVDDIPGSPADGKLPDVLEETGFAAPTATTDGRYVAAIFATGELVCLNLKGERNRSHRGEQ